MASNSVNVETMIVLGVVFLFTYAVGATTSNTYEQGIQQLALTNVVAVKGTVFCDARSENQFLESAYFLPGALVSVVCNINSNRKLKSTDGIVSVEGKTDENGEFRVELPIIHNINPRRSCSVRLLSSPLDSCDIPSISASSQLTLSSSSSNGIQTYLFNPLSYRPSTEQLHAIISSLPRRRALEDSTSKETSSPPPLSSIPQLPKLSFPPLPSIPPLPKLTFPPLPTIPPLNIPKIVTPPLPKFTVPPLSNANAPTLLKLSVPPLPSVSTLPNLSVPPLPITPSLPKFSVPPIPNAPTLPTLNVPPPPNRPILPSVSIPPLPNSPPLNIPNTPPLPKVSFPPLPTFTFPFSQPPLSSIKFPPYPLFTPPPPPTPPSTKGQSP